jgi:hypothetical protein
VLSGVLLATAPFGCSLFGVRLEDEPAHTVEQREGDFEVRRYDPIVVVETIVDAGYEDADGTAFWRLYGYITGDNTTETEFAMTAPVIAAPNAAPSANGGREFAMTAPVISERTEGGWRFAFVLPAGVTLADAPAPTNPEVTLAEVPARRVAVHRFAGNLDTRLAAERELALRSWMAVNSLTPGSGARVAGYDPPWTLSWFRRNEVMIDLP